MNTERIKLQIVRKTFCLTLLFVFLLSCTHTAENNGSMIGSISETRSEYLKTIVGQLSGKFELKNNTFIKSRWSVTERETSRKYLKELITTLGIEVKENEYISPNLNPAIDLLLSPFKGTNVYGILPATTQSNQYIVLGAHYDAGRENAPGAIDNATGIALIYSVVRELSSIETRNKNVVLVFFDQEEEELIGSNAFIKFMKAQEWNVHSVHCFDMVGWDGDGDDAMEIYSASESLLNTYKKAAIRLKKPLKEIRIDPVGYDNNGTDFDAFVPEGFNVIGAGECYYHRDSTPYKDSPDDTYETVNFSYLESCTNFIETVIKEMVRS